MFVIVVQNNLLSGSEHGEAVTILDQKTTFFRLSQILAQDPVKSENADAVETDYVQRSAQNRSPKSSHG